MKKRFLLPLLLIVVLMGLGITAWQMLSREGFRQEVGEFYGTIEAKEVIVSSETGGRIKALHVKKGDRVNAGQLLVEMDTELLDLQIRQAEAALRLAQARLAILKAGPRAEDIRKAEAELAQAEAARDTARKVLEITRAMLANPQDLNAQIHALEGQIMVMEESLKAAHYRIQAAEAQESMFKETVPALERGIVVEIPLPGGGVITRTIETPRYQIDELLYQWNISSQQLSLAWEEYNALKSSLEQTRKTLELLRKIKEDPLTLKEQVHKAEAHLKLSESLVELAEAKLKALKSGARAEDIEAAEAEVDRAKAALEALKSKREKLFLYAPVGGWVTTQAFEEGEIVPPNAAILKIANLEELTLTIFVPEPELGKVRLGQKVKVTVDPFPGETFEGEVVYISPRAEFTPKSVQTKEERVNLVFRVKVRLPNPEGKLKAGMPAEARLSYE
ncbi:MAG: efflux RND transporter periplasmic adaptor subunit [Anaerolineae bacterium]|nr:efflux RND transporter periplasmic adaptor subunit [Anaerolineae bacterium]MDW8102414.1 efflux RND transporter periplasmic adaptor subunit [Anaerolineae bacterium]